MAGRRRGPAGPGGPDAFADPALTESQEGEVGDFIKANDPSMYERLNAAKSRNPRMYRRRMSGIWNTVHEDPEARAQLAKQFKANRLARDLAAQYSRADEKEKPDVKKKLDAAVGELFDADLSRKELQLKNMQANIVKLKEKISERRKMKDKIVASRVERLIGAGDEWEW